MQFSRGANLAEVHAREGERRRRGSGHWRDYEEQISLSRFSRREKDADADSENRTPLLCCSFPLSVHSFERRSRDQRLRGKTHTHTQHAISCTSRVSLRWRQQQRLSHSPAVASGSRDAAAAASRRPALLSPLVSWSPARDSGLSLPAVATLLASLRGTCLRISSASLCFGPPPESSAARPARPAAAAIAPLTASLSQAKRQQQGSSRTRCERRRRRRRRSDSSVWPEMR